ncbi:hypothetical protein QTO01_07240 [Vibrio mytili]|uniref:hypothetical protein n=1 Tax=Vibrio mytili TaxID=50718 RepID=UPI002F41A690
MNDTDVVIPPTFEINQSRWVLKLSTTQPANFELQYDGETHYVGTMEVVNNGEHISVSEANWQFRHKPDKLEQWCQVHHTDTLSINMNYYFADDALVIEYLARNTVPTRLDIRHAIQHLPQQNEIESRNSTPNWQHKRDGLPSDFFPQTEKTDFFREAFSAKQWIVLKEL